MPSSIKISGIATLMSLMFLSGCTEKTSNVEKAAPEEAEAESGVASSFHKMVHAAPSYSFEVTATDTGMTNYLRIVPSGQEIANEPFEHTIEGKVIDAETADLNADGYPELLVFIRSTGQDEAADLIAYSSNNGKSLSMVNFPDIGDSEKAVKGYRGHDHLTVADSVLVRRFRTFQMIAGEVKPTGMIRQIRYRLVDGEAMRTFEIERMFDYPVQ